MLWSLDNLSEIFANLSELLCIRRKMCNFAHKFKFIQNSMVKKCFIYLLFGVVCLGSCSRPKAVYVKTPQTDSIAKVVTGLLVKEEYERAQEVVDSANAAGWLDPFDAQMLRLRIKNRPELSVQQKDSESINRIELMSDAELFEFLRVVIVGEQLYLNPVFDCQQLMERFHLTKERVGAAFSQGSQYVSLAAYINECRLSHGAALLSISPELSISEIATDSGFANASVFTRDFKQRYTITPSEFRQKGKQDL